MKVLMVCLGNICRSPLAEGVLKHLVSEKGLDWEVSSNGTSGYHNGDIPHAGSISIAKQHGIDISEQRSSKFEASDLDYYDLILAMDASNYNDILAHSTSEEQKAKVHLLLNYSNPGMNKAVPDPYYLGGFDKVYDLIYKACEEIIFQHG